jgi:molybdopterin-guanine dinucleotide biosynthesis protein A
VTNEPVALIVNAGGESRRMGSNKALLPVPPTGEALILSILRRLAPLASDQITVVSNDRQVAAIAMSEAASQVVPDRLPAAGSIGGIAAGLTHCQGLAMVVACDMPLVEAAIFEHLITVARAEPQAHAVIPLIGGIVQPFHGVWRKSALPSLETQISSGELALHKALARMNVVWMDEVALGVGPDDWSFYNINTPEDWKVLLAYLNDV